MIFQPQTKSGEIYERNPHIKWQVIEGKVVLVDSLEGELLHLNELGTRIWQKLSGASSLKEILDELSQELDVPFKKLQKDVAKFIHELCQMELVRESRKNS